MLQLPIEIQSKLSSYMRREMTDDNSKGYQRIPTCDPSMSFSPLSSHGSHKNGKEKLEQEFIKGWTLFLKKCY